MPRLLFYVLIAIVAVVWMRRLSSRSGGAPTKNQPNAKGMPQRLVCGACGKEYEPLTNGWLCPQCHR